MQGGRHIFPGAAVERGSFDHDAFRVRVEIHTRINQAQSGELRWRGSIGKERAVVGDCLGGDSCLGAGRRRGQEQRKERREDARPAATEHRQRAARHLSSC